MVGDLAEAQQAGLSATLTLIPRESWDPGDVRYLLATLASFLDRHELYLLLEGADCGIDCPNCHESIYLLSHHVHLLLV